MFSVSYCKFANISPTLSGFKSGSVHVRKFLMTWGLGGGEPLVEIASHKTQFSLYMEEKVTKMKNPNFSQIYCTISWTRFILVIYNLTLCLEGIGHEGLQVGPGIGTLGQGYLQALELSNLVALLAIIEGMWARRKGLLYTMNALYRVYIAAV